MTLLPERRPLTGEATEDHSPAPDRVGPYTVTRLIARGGMGAVYLAVRDGDFHKQVAIKIIKRGMDSDAIVRRFRNERQILAHFNHPGIARLIDGGSTRGGQPYLVMEYIEGEPITGYAEARSLGVRARLGLFRSACAAVQYAHQNLVIHRDLKPGNILVTPDGRTKLLDFGTAKILSPDPTYEPLDLTMTAVRVLTPEYASPEQSRGGVVTTASDVYALGVLAFELLTGRRPYRLRTGSPEEIARAVCEQDAERPSTLFPPGSRLQRELAGDLDAIVLKALEKEAAQRYASVEALSEDIGRYLEGKPVTARRPSAAGRAIKFVRRHSLAVAAASAVGVSLAGGLVASGWQARVAGAERGRAEVERARAERRFNDVRKLAGSFLFEFHDSIQNLDGALPVRQLLVKRGLEYLEGLSREAGGDPALRLELARAYSRLGQVRGDYYHNMSLGDLRGAIQMYDAGSALLEGRGEWPPALRYERSDVLSELYAFSAESLGVLGEVEKGLRAIETARRWHAASTNRVRGDAWGRPVADGMAPRAATPVGSRPARHGGRSDRRDAQPRGHASGRGDAVRPDARSPRPWYVLLQDGLGAAHSRGLDAGPARRSRRRALATARGHGLAGAGPRIPAEGLGRRARLADVARARGAMSALDGEPGVRPGPGP